MHNLNKIKNKLKSDLIEDKYNLSKEVLKKLKCELLQVLKNYTKLKNESININVKILKSNKYLIEFYITADDIY